MDIRPDPFFKGGYYTHDPNDDPPPSRGWKWFGFFVFLALFLYWMYFIGGAFLVPMQ